MKKKTLSALSLIAAGSFTLSGCGAEPNPNGDITTPPSDVVDTAGKNNTITPPPPPPPPFEEGVFDDANGNPIPPVEEDDVEVPGSEMLDSPEMDEETTDDQISAVMGYADGKYTASGSYTSPAGQDSIDVEIVLENGTITGVSVTPKAEDDTSLKLQKLFAQGIPSVVVGKKIEDIDRIAAVNGASLTGKGFMDALETIKDEASL